jgi:hypothetical protein
MPAMNERHIARLEAQLERLVEGVFAQLFGGKRIRAQDIALQLARALEDHSLPARDGDPRLIAPDEYFIYLNPHIQNQLLTTHPNLSETLSGHMIELATQSGYRLSRAPQISFVGDAAVDMGLLKVRAAHSSLHNNSTAAMQPVDVPLMRTTPPPNAQLLVNGRVLMLKQQMITIGRERDNQVILDDLSVSRYHAQLRLRNGVYLLFDTNSKTGIFVNNVPVREHRLQSGDVIRIGKSQLIYLDDDPASADNEDVNGTSELPPIE